MSECYSSDFYLQFNWVDELHVEKTREVLESLDGDIHPAFLLRYIARVSPEKAPLCSSYLADGHVFNQAVLADLGGVCKALAVENSIPTAFVLRHIRGYALFCAFKTIAQRNRSSKTGELAAAVAFLESQRGGS